MTRGKLAEAGSKRVAPNGYAYTKVEGRGWVLDHWLIAEKARGGKKINPENERVIFKDSDRRNLSPDNIQVVPKYKASYLRRKAQLEARIAELKGQLRDLEAEDASS